MKIIYRRSAMYIDFKVYNETEIQFKGDNTMLLLSSIKLLILFIEFGHSIDI